MRNETRRPGIERLEDRVLPSATPFPVAPERPEQEDIVAAVGAALINNDTAYTNEELLAVTQAALQDPSFQRIGSLVGSYQQEQQDLIHARALEEYLLETGEAGLDAARAVVSGEEQNLLTLRAGIAAAVDALLQNPVSLESPLRTDTLALGAGHLDGKDWVMDLPMGGTASLQTWRGKSASDNGTSLAATADVRTALVASAVTPEQIAATQRLSDAMRLQDGYQGTATAPLARMTASTPSLGTVTLQASVSPWEYSRVYHIVRKGDLVMSTQVTVNRYGQVAYVREGQGQMHVAFAGPRYVQWIDVAHLGGYAAGNVETVRADGTKRVYALGSGGMVMIDDTITSLTIKPAAETVAYGLRSINGVTPAVPAVAGEWLKSTGAVAALDLRNAGKCVAEVRGRVLADRPGETLTVVAYRGEEKVAEQTVGKDGTFVLASEGGITGAVITKKNPSSALLVSDVSTTAWKDDVQPAAAALTPATNLSIGIGKQPAWIKGLTIAPAALTNFARGMAIVTSSSFNAVDNLFVHGPLNDPSVYSLHRLQSSSGVRITQVLYLRDDGNMDAVPKEYYTAVGNNAVVFHPGAPKNVVFQVAGRGSAIVAANVVRGETLAEAMPLGGLHVQTNPLVMLSGTKGEGWGDVPDTVPSANFHPMPGEAANMLYEIRNDGTGSGAVRVRVHLGQSGSVSDPVIKEFTGFIESLGRKSLSVNIWIRQAGDSVTLEILGADGAPVSTVTRKIHPPRTEEMTASERASAMSSASWQRLYAKIDNALRMSADSKVVGYLDAIEQNAVSAAAARSQIVSAMVTEELKDANPGASPDTIIADSKTLLALAGVSTDIPGSSGTASQKPVEERYDKGAVYLEAQHWYQLNGELPDPAWKTEVHTDSLVGRFFLGLAQQLQRAHTAGDMTQMQILAEKAQLLTDIPAEKILAHFLDKKLGKLFQEGNYGDIFYNQTDAAPMSTQILSAIPNKTLYHNEDIRIRFDVIPNGKELAYVQVYRADQAPPPASSGNGVLDEAVLSHASNQLFVTVPLSKFTPGMSESVTLLVRAYFRDGTVCDKVLDPIGVDSEGTVIGDYSTLPDTPENLERRQLENSILSTLAKKDIFPLRDPDISQWSWNIASPYHDGQSLNAVDLTLPGAADHGKEVYVPVRGQVVRDGTDDYHSVILRHETEGPNGEQIIWYTKYLHMENVGKRNADGSVSALIIGEWLEENTVQGLVSDVGSPGQYHFHFEVMDTLGDGYAGHTIDMRRLLTDLGITQMYAEDAGADGKQVNYEDNMSFRIQWNNDLGAFVTAGLNGNPMLILDRSDQQSASDVPIGLSNQHWIAWHVDPSKRAHVVFDKVTNAWYQWDTSTNSFVKNAQGISRQWLPNSQEWNYDL
ncbi:MAG: M23 family metallopeptidase [Candidatus Peribacteraceae bacterium]|nr:M23 family metallopeptidase [Candidatus Peribacteraceae bacterium]